MRIFVARIERRRCVMEYVMIIRFIRIGISGYLHESYYKENKVFGLEVYITHNKIWIVII